jgi:hypothetical protein
VLLITIFMEFCMVARSSRREEQHGQSMAWVRHGHGMANVNQTQPHCVNQMGKTHSKPLGAWHGRGAAWEWHALCDRP